jgi:hypothetical protein
MSAAFRAAFISAAPDLSTTQRYIDLAGVLFREEAHAAEARMFGASPSASDLGRTDG